MHMNTYISQLESIRSTLLQSSKEKIIGIAATADRTNLPFILGSIRETTTTIAATIILRDTSFLNEIIALFDGGVDYFMIDCEVKNEAGNLELLVRPLVKKSNILIYKPNDFTVESLDMFVALLFPSLQAKKVLILGAGNIGSKIALKLCERGASIYLYGKEYGKTKIIADGLNLIKRSNSIIEAVSESSAKECDLVLGCAPGIPVVTKKMIEDMHANGKVIDVGNRTIEVDAVVRAKERGIEVSSLSSLGGYTA
jgi:hypothetical protein